MALKINEHCGRTSFEHLLEYGPKQPCYEDVARTKQTLSNWWFVAEFENPNSLKTCLAMDGTDYKDLKLTVRSLDLKEYDQLCGLFDITKARTKRFKKEMKGKRLTIILASNVSSRVTSDALYKFFTFPGDPVEVAMDRARKIALIAYDTEEQGVLALACDQAILGPAMIRIELYRPEKHGRDLQFLLKVGQTGELSHVGAQTGYVQINERAPVVGQPGLSTHQPGAAAQPVSAPYAPAPGAHHPPQQKYPAGYPPGYPPSSSSAAKPDQFATHYAPPSHAPVPTRAYGPSTGGHGNPFSLSAPPPSVAAGPPSPAHPTSAPHAPSASHATSGASAVPQLAAHHHSTDAAPSSHAAHPEQHLQNQPPSGRPESSQDWSKIVPTANYTVTTSTQN